MWFYLPGLYDKDPGGEGQGGGSSADDKDKDKDKGNDNDKDKDKGGQGQKPSDADKGQPQKFTEEDYKHLQAEFTKNSQTLKELHTEMAVYGYEPGEERMFLDEVKAVVDKAKAGEGDGGGGGGSDDELTEGEKQIKALGKVTLQTARRVQFAEYKAEMEKQGRDISPELKQKLETQLGKLLRDAPSLLTDDKNWYGTAMVLLADGDKDFIQELEQNAVTREKERLEKVGADGKPLDDGAAAGGKSETIEEELKKKLG